MRTPWREYIVECLCGHRRHVGENSIGLTGRCPKCGRELVVTDEMLVSENEEPAGVEVAEDAPDRREAKGAVRGFLADDEEEPAEFVEEQPRVSGFGVRAVWAGVSRRLGPPYDRERRVVQHLREHGGRSARRHDHDTHGPPC